MSARLFIRDSKFVLIILVLMVTAVPAIGDLVEIRGDTMGTTYTIKWDDSNSLDPAEVKQRVDDRLAHINRLMSTYDPNSELSQFNQSTSTDWFKVSPETAFVVKAALHMSEISQGAFDPTVGRLVRMWSFGKDPHVNQIPDQQDIHAALRSVGYQHVQTRTTPPAIRKMIPDVEIDLSAIAKGYGVDAIMELLNEQGISACMVEIGGEVRVAGEKSNGPWQLGIQLPESHPGDLQATVELHDQALATSGDYRNYFVHDGTRYSHTIDPRTGSPVTHTLTSASIVTDLCMQADAWATTMMVLGGATGIELANEQGIAAYLIEREGDSYRELTSETTAGLFLNVTSPDSTTAITPSLLVTFLITLTVFGIAIAGLAVGVIFANKSLKGSCGGADGLKDEQGRSVCDLCTTPPEECDQLRQQLRNGQQADEDEAQQYEQSAKQTEQGHCP